jgi:hypothetical protein
MATVKARKSVIFSTFLLVSYVNSNTLLPALKTSPGGRGKLFTGEGPDDPYQGFLEVVLAQGEVCQLLLHPPEQEEIHQSKAW